VGSTYSGTAGAWVAGNILSATSAISVIGNSSGNFYLTGVQLEVGTAATPFERRLYPQELALCQRYYQAATVVIPPSSVTAYQFFYKVSMRAAATVSSAGAGFSTGANSTEGFNYYQTAAANGLITASAEL